MRDFTTSETQQIRVLNRLSQSEDIPLNSDQTCTASPNAVFDETFQLRDYKPISILPISPSVHPKKILDMMGAEDARLRTSPSHEFMFHRECIGKLIDFGYEDGLAKHAELAAFFAE